MYDVTVCSTLSYESRLQTAIMHFSLSARCLANVDTGQRLTTRCLSIHHATCLVCVLSTWTTTRAE